MAEDYNRCRLYGRVVDGLPDLPETALNLIKSFVIQLSTRTREGIASQIESKLVSVGENIIEYLVPTIGMKCEDNTKQNTNVRHLSVRYDMTKEVVIGQIPLQVNSTLFKYQTPKAELWVKATREELLEWPLQLFWVEPVIYANRKSRISPMLQRTIKDFKNTNSSDIMDIFFNRDELYCSHMINNGYNESNPIRTFPSTDLIISILNRFTSVCEDHFGHSANTNSFFRDLGGRLLGYVNPNAPSQLFDALEGKLKSVMPYGTRLIIQLLEP